LLFFSALLCLGVLPSNGEIELISSDANRLLSTDTATASRLVLIDAFATNFRTAQTQRIAIKLRHLEANA